MKKFLSLVLALVMTMSLVTISAGAKDFTDNSTVQYKEAVDVISALGVVNGYEDGSFKPANTLTRGAAAKIICNLLLTPAVASTLTADTAPFKDVPTTNTFAAYIAYVAQQGIINGYKDGTFKPAGTLNGYAFMKMLLGALGYRDGFTGDNWTINVATLVAQLGLADGTTFVGNKTVTREEAALYAFNMGNTETVTYTGSSKVTVNGVVIEQGGSLTPSGKTFFKTNYASTGRNLVKVADYDQDAFGRPAHKWTYNGKAVGVYKDTPVASYVGPVKVSAAYKELGLTAPTAATWYVNGRTNKDAQDKSFDLTLSRTSTATIGEANAYGTTTELYVVSGKPVVVQAQSFAAKVVDVKAAKAETATTDATDRYVILDVYNTDHGTKRVNFVTEEFAKGDILAVTLIDDADKGMVDVQTATATKAVEGTVSRYTSTSATIGGNTYSIGLKSGVAMSSTSFNNAMIYFVDDNNTIVYAATPDQVVSTDYVYVEKVQYKNSASSLFDAASVAAKAEVVFTDGAHSVVDLAVTKDASTGKYYVEAPATVGTVTKTEVTTANATEIGNWFAYVKNTDGTYTLKALNNSYAQVKGSQVLNANATTSVGGGLYTTSATKIVTIDSNYKLSSITGFPSVATTLTGKVLVTYAKGSAKVAAIYAVGQNAPATTTSYAYAIKAGATTATGTEWSFAIDGKVETKVISGSAMPEAGKVYVLTTAADDTYTVGTPVNVVPAGKVDLADLSFFNVGNTTYTYATNVKVYNVSETVDEFGKADVVEEGDTVSVFMDSGKVVVVYITAEAEA